MALVHHWLSQMLAGRDFVEKGPPQQVTSWLSKYSPSTARSAGRFCVEDFFASSNSHEDFPKDNDRRLSNYLKNPLICLELFPMPNLNSHADCGVPATRQLSVIRGRRRRAVTLIEVMIGIAITLVILLVMARFFRQMSQEISKGRAVIEMATEGRAVSELLRRDFANVTVSPRTWTLNSSPNGYFEVIEGPSTDSVQLNPLTAAAWATTPPGYLGDFDDVLAMTVRSRDLPYRGRSRSFDGVSGRYANSQQVLTSEIAEVVMWAGPREAGDLLLNQRDSTDGPGHSDQLNIYRKVLLIRPDIDLTGFPADDIDHVRLFFAFNDISARWVDSDADGIRDRLVANSLADLAVRENRFAHNVDDHLELGDKLSARVVVGHAGDDAIG